jgi:hypothetical protein
MPCIYDTRFARDAKGNLLFANGTGPEGKVVRRNRFVKMGKKVGYVDFASRKYFKPVDREAEDQNEKDREWLLKELAAKGIDDIPDDATLSELGATYDKFDPRLAVAMRKVKRIRSRIFGSKKGKKKTALVSKPENAAEKKALQEWLKENKVPFHPANGIAKLKELKEAKEEELTNPGTD